MVAIKWFSEFCVADRENKDYKCNVKLEHDFTCVQLLSFAGVQGANWKFYLATENKR